MLREIWNQGIVFYVVAGVCAGGTLSVMILNILYGRLIKDAKNLASPKTKLMKEIKNKFENSYRLKEKVHNVEAFTENCLCRYKTLGFTLHRIKRISLYAMGLCAALSGAGVYAAVHYGEPQAIVVNYIGAGIGSLLILGAVRGIADTSYKQHLIMVNVRDYLENSLLNRLQYDQPQAARIREKQLQPEQKEVKEAKKEIRKEVRKEEKPQNQPAREKAQPVQSEKVVSRDKLSKRDVKENVDRMKESMEQIAAGNAKQRQKNREILQSMEAKEQEEIIREILKEFLS